MTKRKLKQETLDILDALIRSGHPVHTPGQRIDIVVAAVDLAKRVDQELYLESK
jgi:hypothetical protein